MAAAVRTGPTLPAELLVETFRYLSLPDRVAARAVCRAWHAVADACPVHVPSGLYVEPEQLRCYLGQMRAAPLLYGGIVEMDDTWLDDPGEPLDVAEVIAAHMDHTVVLSLEIAFQDEIPQNCRAALEAPAPLLRKLWLEFSWDNEIDDIALFAHCAPRLTHCSLYATSDIVAAISPFQTIQVLVLRGWSWHQNFVLALTSFPALRELALEPCHADDIANDDDDDEDEYECKYKPMDPPARLARLTITSESLEIPDIAPLFSWITHDAIRVVCARHFCRRDEWAQALGARPEIVQRILDVLVLPAVDSLVVSCAQTECALRLVAPDGRERVHAGVPRETLAVLLKTAPLAANLTDLVVAGVHVLYTPDLVQSLNHFKALRSFTLVLRRLPPESEHFSASRSVSLIPFPASLSIPPIYCPALESVTLAITEADYNRTGSLRLSTKEVREFLRDKLREDLRGKLKTLCFRGVSVEDPAALWPLADEIHLRAYEPLAGFVYPEDDIRRFDQDDLLAG